MWKKQMKWSYGVTTVPSRFDDLLPRTLESLRKAGFERPRLFIDGAPTKAVPEHLRDYEKTFRSPNISAYGNWILALWELYLREPRVDLYAVFQDDFITYPNLRQYLESCTYPHHGYWNLFTFPENEKSKKGWYQSNQAGLGAVALVFNNEAVRLLLGHQHMVDRPLSATRGKEQIDGGVVTAFRKSGWQEYVHNPSLVQHTGTHSALGHGRYEDAHTFRGEDFDAMSLTQEFAHKRTTPSSRSSGNRIGLVGYNCASGLGELNRQLATYADVDTWMVQPHPNYLTLPSHENVDTMVCSRGDRAKITQFLRGVDVVVFCERPYYNELLPLCKSLRKRTVCIPMMEWMPSGARGWPQSVDLFICPTKQCYDVFHRTIPCNYFPWPVDVTRYPPQKKAICNEFLFLAGHGGFGGRKGIDVILKARELWPEIPLVVRSQVDAKWPSGIRVLPPEKDNPLLYSVGDVIIAPHSVDGLGLEPMEAMACGIPVISTDGEPWNEIPSIAKIPSSKEKRVVRRPVDWYLPDPKALVEVCQGLLGKDISGESQRAREWAESMDWEKHKEAFIQLVLTGSKTIKEKVMT